MGRWRIIKLGGGNAKVVPILGRCKSGSAAHGTQCEERVRDSPGATRCLFHKDEEKDNCAKHDKRNCKECEGRIGGPR